MEPVGVSRAQADALWELRTRVLRPAWEPGRLCVYPEDGLEGTAHWVATRGDRVVGCVTLMRGRPSPHAPAEEAIQLRGMAVSPELQGQGVGARLLEAALSQIAVEWSPLEVIWCNARVKALSFYARAGFTQWGEEFFIPEAGDHYVMWRALPRVVVG